MTLVMAILQAFIPGRSTWERRRGVSQSTAYSNPVFCTQCRQNNNIHSGSARDDTNAYLIK